MRSKIPTTLRVSFYIQFCLSLLVLPLQAQERQSKPEQSGEIVRISTELVQTGVTVIDKQGRFVDGLNREQFELRVDGKPQPISFFERVAAGSITEGALLAAARGEARSSTEKDRATAPSLERGRTIFFFVDDLHLSANSVVRSRETLLRFVDNTMGPNDLVAITTASGQLGFLQQLTNDKAVLRAAIKRLTYRPYSVTDLTTPPMTEYQALALVRNDRDAIEYFVKAQLEALCGAAETDPRRCKVGDGVGPVNNAVFDETYSRGGRTGNTGGGTSGTTTNTGTSRGEAGAATTTIRTLQTQAINLVKARARMITQQATRISANTLLSLESLIRTAAPISERKLVIFLSDGFFINYVTSSNVYDLRRITDAATRSGTVIYTIDARGLVSGQQDASASGAFDTSGKLQRVNFSEVTASQEAFSTLAEDTGGRAWLNSNTLDPGIVEALKETSDYYLLAWRPDPEALRGEKFHTVEVRVKDRPELTVRVQRGFFDESSQPSVKNNSTSPGQPKSVDEELFAALKSPYPKRSLPVSLSLGYMDSPNSGTVLTSSLQVNGEALRSGADGNAEVDVMGMVADDTGKVVHNFKQRLTAASAQRRLIHTDPIQLKPGLYQVRVAARAVKSGFLGSAMQWIEVPDVARANFSLGSIFISESAAGSQKAELSPDRRLARTSRLGFLTHIYNAARVAAPPDVEVQVKILRDGREVIATPPGKLPTEGSKDLARIPFGAEIALEQFPVGRYVLQIMATDRAAKSTASQQIAFTIE